MSLLGFCTRSREAKPSFRRAAFPGLLCHLLQDVLTGVDKSQVNWVSKRAKPRAKSERARTRQPNKRTINGQLFRAACAGLVVCLGNGLHQNKRRVTTS